MEAQALDSSKGSTFYRSSSHPLIVVIAGGVIVGLLTQYYTSRQKEFEYERNKQQLEQSRHQSFADELNKNSIQKFGDVWQRIDENDLAIDALFSVSESESLHATSALVKKGRLDELRRLTDAEVRVLSRNKFWIGEELYVKANDYVHRRKVYGQGVIARTRTDLPELKEQVECAKQDLLDTRSLYLQQKKTVFQESGP
jgi:hypothetical protein